MFCQLFFHNSTTSRLTKFLLIYIPTLSPHRGASSRDVLKAEQDAAPAGKARNLAPGRPRATVRRHDDRLPLMAGRGADEGGRKPARRNPPSRARKIRSRGQKSRLWRAERRRTFARRCAHKDGCAGRRATPSLVCERGQEGGLPGAGQRIRAMNHARDLFTLPWRGR